MENDRVRCLEDLKPELREKIEEYLRRVDVKRCRYSSCGGCGGGGCGGCGRGPDAALRAKSHTKKHATRL